MEAHTLFFYEILQKYIHNTKIQISATIPEQLDVTANIPYKTSKLISFF